jgi:hypothetical protein
MVPFTGGVLAAGSQCSAARPIRERGEARGANVYDSGMAGFVTPTHALLLLAALVAFFVLGRLRRGDAQEAAAAHGRRARRGLRGLLDVRLRKPTRREAHVGWLIASAVVAFAFTRGIAVPVFLLVFVVLWLSGFGVLGRIYR